jgi:hypothetical protein
VLVGVCASLQVKPRRRKNVAQKTNEAGRSEIEVDVKDEEKEARGLALRLVSFEIDLRSAADLPLHIEFTAADVASYLS